MEKPSVLIADDQLTILLVLEEMLEDHYEVSSFSDGAQLLEHLAQGGKADLILTDAAMPGVNGFEVCRRLKSAVETQDIPLLFISGLDSEADETLALSLGADDFIHKPFCPPVVLARIRNHLALFRAKQSMQRRNEELERLVEARTAEIVRRGKEVMAAQEATISALCALAEVRDNETGNHILRTQHYVLLLAEDLASNLEFADQLGEEDIRRIVQSAPLHDVGKVAIPDAILLKAGKLDAEEWNVMKRHCEYGANAIGKAIAGLPIGHNSYLSYGIEIARSHHERWDGTGYPQGLAGRDIPLSARLMAIADVYDALVTRRVYKPAMDHGAAAAIIRDGAGSHFDPAVVAAFNRVEQGFREVAQRLCDPE